MTRKGLLITSGPFFHTNQLNYDKIQILFRYIYISTSSSSVLHINKARSISQLNRLCKNIIII